jgi:hypothetical protein
MSFIHTVKGPVKAPAPKSAYMPLGSLPMGRMTHTVNMPQPHSMSAILRTPAGSCSACGH